MLAGYLVSIVLAMQDKPELKVGVVPPKPFFAGQDIELECEIANHGQSDFRVIKLPYAIAFTFGVKLLTEDLKPANFQGLKMTGERPPAPAENQYATIKPGESLKQVVNVTRYRGHQVFRTGVFVVRVTYGDLQADVKIDVLDPNALASETLTKKMTLEDGYEVEARLQKVPVGDKVYLVYQGLAAAKVVRIIDTIEKDAKIALEPTGKDTVRVVYGQTTLELEPDTGCPPER